MKSQERAAPAPIRLLLADPRRWLWGAVVLSVLVCGSMAWLHWRQRLALDRESAEVGVIRQARIELTKGFLYACMAGDADSPFQRDQARTMLQQAISTFDKAMADNDLMEEPASTAFRDQIREFQALLDGSDNEGSGKHEREAKLRVSFHRLEMETDRIDLLARHNLRKLAAHLDLEFAAALCIAALLMTGVCSVVFFTLHAHERSESRRRAGEARHGITLRSIGDGVITTGVDAQVELLNPVAEALTGWSTEEARGRPLREVFHILNEETRMPVESPVERVLREGTVTGLANHTLLVARNGEERPIADSGAPILDEHGQVTGVVLIFRDQTEERAAQAALLRSELMNRSLVEHLPQRIFVKDLNSVYKLCNANYARDLGIDSESVAGRNDFDFHPPELAEKYRADDRTVMAAGTLKDIEELYRVGDVEYYIHTIKVPFLDEAGKVVGVLGIFEDITERKQAEARRIELENQLLQAQKIEAVGRLAGGVAHDFNNMLGVILGHTELALEATDPDDPRFLDLKEIEKAAFRSANLTRQLLAFARKQTISPRVADLNDIVSGTLSMLRRLIGENIDLAWMPGDDLWNVKVDPSQVEQVLANLTVNARDAINGVGRITIETSNTVLDEGYCAGRPEFVPGEYVLLAVSDDGCGMGEEVLQCVFEPFFTTKEMGRGTGLGLATVYGIVRQNLGFVNVYSEPGRGATFKIYLPKFEGEAVEIPVEKPAESLPTGVETVLIVEDEEAIMQLGRTILTRLGYRALTAGTPKEAIRVAAAHNGEIQLLITDVVMPEMNGRELAERLRAIRPGLKCLFMSGYTSNVVAHHGILDEDVLFVQKPFSMRTLAEKVREALLD